MRILLAEDEDKIRKSIELNLTLEGYEVVTAADGRKALDCIESQHFDLLVLDIMLPEVDGFTICEKIRLRNKSIGIIIVSARDGADDRITGLKLGADDYLTKPFHFEELMLRIRNILKRKETANAVEADEFSWNGNSVNFVTFSAIGPHGKIELTNKETLLLKLFAERKNEVVSRQQILQTVWGYDVYPSTRTIDNFILSIRKYFEEDPKEPKYFHSIRGVGYKFTP